MTTAIVGSVTGVELPQPADRLRDDEIADGSVQRAVALAHLDAPVLDETADAPPYSCRNQSAVSFRPSASAVSGA